MGGLYFRVSSDCQASSSLFADTPEEPGIGKVRLRIAIYLRVSTKDGRQETENQRLQLRRLAESQDWEIVLEYEDHESGGSSERADFRAMMKAAATREFDLVLFWSLDRFSREGTLQTLKYLEQLESYGVRWRSFTEPWIDSAGPFRDVIVSLLASLAKQERVRIGERVKAGLGRAKVNGTRSGRPVGRPRVIFDRKEVIRLRDEEELSWSKISSRLGVSIGTVRRTYEALSEKPRPVNCPQSPQSKGQPK